jgi:hypothetical protein
LAAPEFTDTSIKIGDKESHDRRGAANGYFLKKKAVRPRALTGGGGEKAILFSAA